MRILADVAAAAQTPRGLDEMAQALADLLVPRVADLCLIDRVGPDGEVRRLAGAFSGPAPLLQALLVRPPSTRRAWPPSRERAQIGSRAWVVDERLLRELAYDEEDFQRLSAVGLESCVVVPLLGREDRVGTLALGTRAPRPRFTEQDVSYLETLAGRVALAIENAVLSAELSTTERQFEAILAGVDVAIIVRNARGRLVYLNDAAAELLRVPSREAAFELPGSELMRRFDVYTEEGEQVELSGLPGMRLLAGEVAPPPLVVRNVVKATGEERWLLHRATPVTDGDGNVLMSVVLVQDITESKRNEIAQRLLAQTAREVAQSYDPVRTLQAVADAAVPGLADWAGVDLIDRAGRIETVAVGHRDPARVQLGWRLRTQWPAHAGDPDGLAEVLRSGEAQLVSDISDEMLAARAHDAEHLALLREVALKSTMIAPIRAGSRVLGALSFVSSTSRRFDERDLQLACDLGQQVGIFVQHARLYAEQVEIAQTLQAGLLPDVLVAPSGWEISSAYRAAGGNSRVGGDFYDLVTVSGGSVAIIGDVVGKGAEAAALTGLARHTLGATIEATGDIELAFTVLNRRLCERGSSYGGLCTLAVVRLGEDGTASAYSAGHPLPLLRRGGEVSELGTSSPLLGYLREVKPECTEVRIEPGDQIVLYTDGVLDAVGPDDRFGEERLFAAVRGLGDAAAAQAAPALMRELDQFLHGEQSDDIAILTLTRV